MTKIIKKEMYCTNCKKSYEVPVVLSTNSFMIQNDPELRKKAMDGTLFKNFCPVCKQELVNKKDE
jgi:hypothetical protein